VNAEPDETGFGPLPELERGMRGVVELTERTLTNRLAELLPAVQRARADGWGIALDDVGADTRSLALMPVLRPDVIKLDLRLVQEQPTPEIAAIAGAVGAQAERTGATVVAEGIETQEQVSTRGRSARPSARVSCSAARPRSRDAARSPGSRCRSSRPRSPTPGRRRLTWPAPAVRCAAERCRCSHRSAANWNARRHVVTARRC
jgi:predicted signal transduction protein with EAL and GGDEF domain